MKYLPAILAAALALTAPHAPAADEPARSSPQPPAADSQSTPADSSATSAALDITVELLEPRDTPLIVRLSAIVGEPFRQFQMDGRQSYTLRGKLTDLGEGRYELTITIVHWQSAEAKPTFTTTVQLTANKPHTWVRFVDGTRHRQTATVIDPAYPEPRPPNSAPTAAAIAVAAAAAAIDAATTVAAADLADQSDAAAGSVTPAAPGRSQAWQAAVATARQTDAPPAGELMYVLPWKKLIIPLADSDGKRLELKVQLVIAADDWPDMQELLETQREALRLDVKTYLATQKSDDLYGGENLDRISRAIRQICNRGLFNKDPATIREVLLTEFTIH